jgi:GNAT superfamily N-acetyltransferase
VNLTTEVRELAPSDAETLLELSNVCDIAEVGEPSTTSEEVEADFANPDLELVGIESDNQLIGYAWFECRADNERVWAAIRARPRHEEPTLTTLLDWVQARAAQAAPDRPIWTSAGSTNHAKRALFEAAGGTVIRRFYRMLIDFDVAGEPPAPVLRDGVEIDTMPAADAGRRTMHRLVNTAFEDHFGHEPIAYDVWERGAMAECSDPSMFWIATVDGEPAAGLYGCVLPESGYVDTLGTLREFRGRGLGRALLLTAFDEFNRRGVRRVSPAVDATSPTGALDLYESVGMQAVYESCRYELPPQAAKGRSNE